MIIVKVKCSICGVEGVIEYNFKPSVVICEFCYLNLRKKDTTDGENRFFIEN